MDSLQDMMVRTIDKTYPLVNEQTLADRDWKIGFNYQLVIFRVYVNLPHIYGPNMKTIETISQYLGYDMKTSGRVYLLEVLIALHGNQTGQ